MQSRLVAGRLLPSPLASARLQVPPWPLASSTSTRTANPTGKDAEQAAGATAGEKDPLKTNTIEENQPTPPTPATPFAPSPKLGSTGVGARLDPSFQQKRQLQTDAASIEEVSCVGVDGTSPSGSTEESAEEDYREYYKNHKPSPLSEIEYEDTRLPIRRATDSTADADDETGRHVVGWRPEQIDTAEEALRRADAIFRKRAEEGVPDWPQSKVLVDYCRKSEAGNSLGGR